MKQAQERLQFREVGKGFILLNQAEDGAIGRRLTKTFVDQHNKTYVQINGQMEPLSEQHSYLAID